MEVSGWNVEVCDGAVDRQRKLIPIELIPEKPPGEFYATWIAEKAGFFWCPWIIWDVDDPDLQNALLRTQTLVQRLQNYQVPDDAIRVVFSTNKGFHVYLDSRTVGLRPSRTLHAELRLFCGRLMQTDKSLYDARRVIGVPNSKHRKTERRYSIIPLDMLVECEIADLQELTLVQRDIEPMAESVDLIETLAKFMEPEKRTGLSTAALQKIAHDPLPEWFGVGEGARDAAAFKLASYYQRLGLSEAEASVLCYDANKRNVPPLTDGVVKEKLWRVFRK